MLVLATTAANPAAGQVDPSEPADGPPRPDIVVIYVDDYPQQVTDLWSDPERTPALARFVEDGLWLSAATGSTPTCCPGRANTLTGTWGHRSGVTENDMAAFDPADTVAVRLGEQGYRTYFGGKFLNRLPRYVRPPSSVEHYAQGWDEFDVGLTNHGAYYDYPLWTRSDGRMRYGDAETDHSTFVVTNRMTEHIRSTPAGGADLRLPLALRRACPVRADAALRRRPRLRRRRALGGPRLRRGRRLGQARVRPGAAASGRACL